MPRAGDSIALGAPIEPKHEMPEEERKVERSQYTMYRRAALAIVIAWMAKTRSLAPIVLALKVVAAVAFVGAAGAAIFLLVPNHLLVPSSKYRKAIAAAILVWSVYTCLLYTSPSPRDGLLSRMPSSA